MEFILIRTLQIFFSVLNFSILVRCILSWFRLSRDNPIIQVVLLLTEPILAPIRKILNNSPIGGGMLDFSPILAIMFLGFAQNILIAFIISVF